jgi:CTD kinase subunit alpha
MIAKSPRTSQQFRQPKSRTPSPHQQIEGDMKGPSIPDTRVSQNGLVTTTNATTPDTSQTMDSLPLELYEIVSQVGEGTFGKVYKARNTLTSTLVALKRIRMEGERDGFPVTAMREIKLLQSLQHMNVVQLYEMMVAQGELLRASQWL